MKRGRLVGAILAVIALFGIHTQQVGRALGMDQTQYTPVQQRVLDSMLIDAQRAAKGALSDREKRLLAGAEGALSGCGFHPDGHVLRDV